MAERPLTPEQEVAAGVDGAAVVRAGAGTGKTRVLAERFLHLVRPGGVGDAGRILAITFTEKAATEMRRKIRDLVAERLAAAAGDERAHWERVRRDLLGAPISTIHAFCARVLRENPLEAGIDPQATVLDEHESRAYLDDVVGAELVARLRAGDPAARSLVARHGLAGGRRGGAVRRCRELVTWLGTTGRDAAWLAEAGARQAALAPEAEAALGAAAARVVATVAPALGAKGGKGGKGRKALAEAWPRWETFLQRLGPQTPLGELLTLRELCALLAKAQLAGAVGRDLRLDGAGRLRGELPDAYGFLVALDESSRVGAFLGALADAIRARKRADAVLTFDDLVSETRTVLRDHPAVRARYAERFRAILVDELQDTDAVQAEVVRRLVGGPEPPVLFVVGDEKQSIYRFRGADVAVFQGMREALGRTLPLGTNFRSQPAILDFVNALAAAVLRPPPGPERAYWTRFDESQRLVPDRAQTWPEPVRLVTFVSAHARRAAEGHELSAAEAREQEARVLAGLIERLRAEHGVRYRDIAVLFRALTQVKAYEYALRRLEIPYYVVKGRGFFQCQEVGDVVNLLATLADPDDQIALAATLRSPFFAVDDDTLWRLAWPEDAARPALGPRFRRGGRFDDLPEQADALGRARDLLLRLRRLRHRASVAELLEEAFAATDFEAVCLTQFQGGQKVANARKLIELARALERRRHATLADFVRTVRALAAEEPQEAEATLVGEEDEVVRLMTIHQAKGLEFGVVIVPDLGRRPPPESDTTVVDEELGAIVTPVDGAGRMLLGNRALERHREAERDREHAERARLFYVACTRARDQLILLEGKGDAAYLAHGRGDAFSWCHQVWDLIGRERLAAFAAGSVPSTVLELGGAGRVLVERAELSLERAAAHAPRPPEPREAEAGSAERAHVGAVLGFRPPAPSEVVTSPTALADFRRCPRQYWYRHVLGLPERGTGGTRATLLGAAAHGVLEALDVESATDDDVTRAVDARPEALVLSRRERARLAADLCAAAAALRADVAAGVEIVGREVPFVLGLPPGRPRVVLNGRLDLLVRRGGTHVVRDYKYAAASPEAVAGYGDQLGAYQVAVAAAGAAPVVAELVFLRGGTTVEALPPCDVDGEAAALVAAGTALGDALGGGAPADFPRRPPDAAACARLGCGYVRRCWAGARAGTCQS